VRASLVARAERVSAGHVEVDGLVGHRGDQVVIGAGSPGVGARERLSGPDRTERALVHGAGADAIHDDLVTLRA
jgi:hypothetical protein